MTQQWHPKKDPAGSLPRSTGNEKIKIAWLKFFETRTIVLNVTVMPGLQNSVCEEFAFQYFTRGAV